MNVTDIDDKIIIRAKEQKVNSFEFAKEWELSFFSDMEALGVKKPDSIVRVSEHIPEIIEFVDRIVKRGYGYESNGSVYFDIEQFKKSGHHKYPKLEPNSATNSTKVLVK
jgi:cysteinyl-tRNA synthetase